MEEDDRSEDQHAIESDYEEEEVVAEMTPPRVSSWTGDGGATVQGVVVNDDGVRNKGKIGVCSICNETCTTEGTHRICCIPCGHMYGMSCIEESLQRQESPGKCPQCNTSCTLKDVRMLYPTPLCVGDQTPQKASPTKHFPFTKDGFNAFNQYASKQRALAFQSPRVSSWTGDGGATVLGVVVNDDGVRDKGEIVVCPICYETLATEGTHRICCVPCGHMYGMSCIKKWLQQQESCQSPGKCPQCNTLCTLKDVRLLYAARLSIADPTPHKASSTRHFPFTQDGLNAYKQYVRRQRGLTLRLLASTRRQHGLVKRQRAVVSRQWVIAAEQWGASGRLMNEAWLDDALGRLMNEAWLDDALGRLSDALGPRAKALLRRAKALVRRHEALKRRDVAWEENVVFFEKKYKDAATTEHTSLD